MHPPARASRGRKRVRDGDDEPASTAAKAETLIASPRGLSLLLEVRALLGSMVERRAQIDMRLRTIDTRLDALADAPRGGPRADAAIAPLQSPPPSLIDDLPVELLALVAGALEPDDHLATSLACRKLRAAVALAQQLDGRITTTTLVHTALTSLRKLKWAISCRLPKRASLCNQLAEEGRLVELSWLKSQRCEWTAEVASHAAFGGHLHVLQWARAKGCKWDSDCCSSAAEGGHLGVLQWARANGCPWDEATAEAAAEGGFLHVLQWARANGCPWDEGVTSGAARSGQLEVLEWLQANNCPWDEDMVYQAAGGGHLEVLKWLRATDNPYWDEYIAEHASAEGHLEVLQWAHAHGCPWDGSCAVAALFGQMEVLTWLHANGCPWGEDAVRAAVRGGHLGVLQWLRANGCPWGKLSTNHALYLLEGYELEFEDPPLFDLEEAHGYRPSWDSDSWRALQPGEAGPAREKQHAVSESIVSWLRANGCPEMDPWFDPGEDEDGGDEDEQDGDPQAGGPPVGWQPVFYPIWYG